MKKYFLLALVLIFSAGLQMGCTVRDSYSSQYPHYPSKDTLETEDQIFEVFLNGQAEFTNEMYAGRMNRQSMIDGKLIGDAGLSVVSIQQQNQTLTINFEMTNWPTIFSTLQIVGNQLYLGSEQVGRIGAFAIEFYQGGERYRFIKARRESDGLLILQTYVRTPDSRFVGSLTPTGTFAQKLKP